MARVPTVPASRPMVFCTDERALKQIASQLPTANLDLNAPSPHLQAAGLLEKLTEPKSQGDSHFRLLLEDPGRYELHPQLAPMVLRAFYRLLWLQNQDLGQRGSPKLQLRVLSGEPDPQAFLDVSCQGACHDSLAAVAPGAGPALTSQLQAALPRRRSLAAFFSRASRSTPRKVSEQNLLDRIDHLALLALETTGSRIAMELDVVIIGNGPSGLAVASALSGFVPQVAVPATRISDQAVRHAAAKLSGKTLDEAVGLHTVAAGIQRRCVNPTVPGQFLWALRDRDTTALNARVDEKIAQFEASIWQTASRCLVHVNFACLLVATVDYQVDPGFTRLIFVAALVVLNILYLRGAVETLEQTRTRIRSVCVVIHCVGVFVNASGAWESKEDYLGRSGICEIGQIVIALIFPMQRITSAFAVAFLGANLFAALGACGPSAITGWFVVQQLVQMGVVVSVPVVMRSVVRDHVKASCDSQDSDSLASALSYVLKGVSDGHLLLDSNFKICGNASCLQRLLRTHENFSGRSFVDLVAGAPSQKPFAKFLAEGGEVEAKGGMPHCARVHLLDASGQRVAVDIVHAVVPELYGTATHHLLVIKEDPEARAMSPLQSPVSENLPDRQDIRKEAIAGNERQRTREEMLHPLRQISEMTLLVNASTELIEIEQAVIQCAPCAPKEEEEDATTLGVLNLHGWTCPSEWHAVKSKLHQVARAVGEDVYLRARSVSIKPACTGIFQEQEPALLYLHLSKFNKYRQRRLTESQIQGQAEAAALVDALRYPEGDGRGLSLLHSTKQPALRHAVIGSSAPGGSWQSMSPSTVTLSPGSWMDLPGYSLEEHLKSDSSKEARRLLQKVSAEALAASRVPRWLVAEYYVAYARRLPSSSFINGTVTHMAPEGESWKLQISASPEEADSCAPKLEIKANAVVLAMGMADLPETLGIPGEDLPWVTHRPPIHSPVLMEKIGHLLVVGAGLSAADAILHTLRRGKVRVTHVFRGKALSTKVGKMFGTYTGNGMYEDEEWLVQLMTGAVQDERYTPLAESELLDIQDDGSCRVRGPTQELLSVSNVSVVALLLGSGPRLSWLPASLRRAALERPRAPQHRTDGQLSSHPQFLAIDEATFQLVDAESGKVLSPNVFETRTPCNSCGPAQSKYRRLMLGARLCQCPCAPNVRPRGRQPMGQSTSVSEEVRQDAGAAPKAKAVPKPALRAPRSPPESSSPSVLQQAVDAVVGRRLEDVVEVSSSSKPLGCGAFGTVWRGRYLDGGCAVAVKSLDKSKMKQMKVPDTLVTAEVEFMRECKGQPWFVQLYDFLDTSHKFYLLLELCDGGNLEDAARSLNDGLSEARCAAFMQQLLSGIAFLHSRKICHRDIKPQNAMLLGDARDSSSRLRLGDFGIAVRLGEKLLTEKLGTPAFMAPEMHMLPKSNGYDCKVDLWAAGTFMVFLLSLEYPFVDPSGRLLKNDLLRGDLPIWEGNAFQSLFRNVQEAAGLRRKRQSVPGSPHRKMQSRTLPMLQVAGAQALKTLTGSSSAASNHQLVRANQIHIHKQWSQGTQKDWLPRPDSLPAGHPLLYRSLQNWRADEGRQGSKQSRGRQEDFLCLGIMASAARYSSKQSASAARYDSKQSVMTRTSQADASRSGSKHSALPAMGKTFSSAGAIAQTSNAFTVGVSMRDISSVDNFRGRSSSPPPVAREDTEKGSLERTVSKSRHATELVHELRDMVNEDERRERGETKKWLGQDGSLPQSIRQLDYWTARDSFTLYDVKKTGHLDRRTFYNLLKGISRLQDNINEELSEAIFEEIDINKSGGIDEDEFLGWVFQTNNFRLNHLREKLVQLPQEQVQRIFRKIDKTGDGNLDKMEFWRFIETIGGRGSFPPVRPSVLCVLCAVVEAGGCRGILQSASNEDTAVFL
eukprot:s109_g23.t1